MLGELAGLLAPGGLVVFSSHNLAHWERTAPAESGQVAAARQREVGARLRQQANRSPAWMVNAVLRLPHAVLRGHGPPARG